MSDIDHLSAIFIESSRNMVFAWLLIIVLAITVLLGFATARYEQILYGLMALCIIIAPSVVFRDPTIMPPWYFIALICIPLLWEAYIPYQFETAIIPSLAIATLGLLMVVELHRFTILRLVPWFAITLTMLFTLAIGGVLYVIQWSTDVVLGTSLLLDGRSEEAINATVMIEFIYFTVAGILAGILFWLYYRHASADPTARMAVPESPQPEREDVTGVQLSSRLGISVKRQTQLARVMQFLLSLILLYGIWSRQIEIITNASIALLITAIPPILERDYHIAIEPGLVLWITSAVFLHTIGTAWFYDTIAHWDHLTHTLSASVVAAGGYAVLRGIHLHVETIYLPRWALFSFTIVFVIAMGVIWEILEFFIDQSALMLGIQPILAQHGITDTMLDMIFNIIGAVIVAAWGTVYLTEISESLANWLEHEFSN